MTMQAEIFGLYLLLAFLSILAPFVLVATVQRFHRWRVKRHIAVYRSFKKALRLTLGESEFEGEMRKADDGTMYKYIPDEELRKEWKRLNEVAEEYGNQKAWWIVPYAMRSNPFFNLGTAKFNWMPFNPLVVRFFARFGGDMVIPTWAMKLSGWQPLQIFVPFYKWVMKGEKFSKQHGVYMRREYLPVPKTPAEIWQDFFYRFWTDVGLAQVRLARWLYHKESILRFHYWPVPEMIRSQAMKKHWWIDQILETRKRVTDHPRTQRDFGYWGNLPDDGAWGSFGLGAYHRDTQWENTYITMSFRKEIEEKYGEEGEQYMIERYSHWAVGWVEAFFIRLFTDARQLWVTDIAKWTADIDEDGYNYLEDQDYYTVEDAQHVSELYYAADQFIDEELVPEQLLETYRLSWLMSRDWNTIWNGKDPEGLEVSKWQIENEELLSHDSFDHWGIPAWAVALKDVGHSESVYYDGEGNSRLMVAIELLEMAGWLDYDKLDEAARKETESKWGSGWNSVKNWRSDLANVKRADLAEILGIRYEPWIDPNREAKKRMKPMFTEKTETLTLYDWREADGRARKEDEDVEE